MAASYPDRQIEPADRRGRSLTARDVERVVVINDDSVRSGGAAAIAITTAREIRRKGRPVTFMTGDDADNPELLGEGVDIYRLGGQHLLSGSRATAAWRGLYDGATGRRLHEWIARHDTPRTIYHLHNWHKCLSPSIFAALRRVEERLVLSLHDFFLACPNGGFYDFRAGSLCEVRPLGMACLATSCDKRNPAHKVWRTARHMLRAGLMPFTPPGAVLLAVHEGMLPLLARGGIEGPRVRVLHNPVTPWLDERANAESNRDVLFVGRLEQDKGIDLLAEAVDSLGLSMSVAGDGPLRAELERSYPSIRFLGNCTKEEIANVAFRARIVAVPTLVRETFGLVAMEALASGLPVIMSDASLIAPEILARGMGLTVTAGSLPSLIAALRRIEDDDVLVARLSANAFQAANVMISGPEAWAGELLAIYCGSLADLSAEHDVALSDFATEAAE